MVLLSFRGMNFKLSRKGMSFAEIMFSIAIVAGVLVTIIGTLTTGLEALQKSINYNQANIIAQRIVEIYKSTDYDFIPPGLIDNELPSVDGFVVHVRLTAEHNFKESTTLKYRKLTVIVTNEGEVSNLKKKDRKSVV